MVDIAQGLRNVEGLRAASVRQILEPWLDRLWQVPGNHDDNRFAYVLYLCSGLLPWLAFADCVTRGCNAFAENATYLRKLPIPEQVFVAKSATAATLGLCISFGLLLLVRLCQGLVVAALQTLDRVIASVAAAFEEDLAPAIDRVWRELTKTGEAQGADHGCTNTIPVRVEGSTAGTISLTRP